MNVREELMELFYENNVRCDQKIEGLADDVVDIIAHNVTVPQWISVKDMDVKERLIELQMQAKIGWTKGQFADYLMSHGVTVQEWVSVDDKLPEEKVKCIVRYKHAYCDNDGYWAIGISFYDGEEFQIGLAYKVTHWMPLPEPPKGE